LDYGIGVKHVKHFRHLLIFVEPAGRTAELHTLGLTRTDYPRK